MAIGLKQKLKRPLLMGYVALGRLLCKFFERETDLEHVRSVLIIQFGGFGDVLRVFPIVENLVRHLPEAKIVVLSNAGSGVFELMPGNGKRCEHAYLDLGWGYFAKLAFVLKMRRRRFDLVINPTRGDGMVECSVLAFLVGARYRLGFDRRNAGFLHTTNVELDREKSIVSQNTDLLARIGVPVFTRVITLQISRQAHESAAAITKALPGDSGPLIAVHPWASSHPAFREWPEGHYLTLIRELLQRHGATVMLLGSDAERARSQSLCTRIRHPKLIDLSGRTDLPGVAALLERSDLFIGNDSGLLHLAVALKTPSVAIFGATSATQVLQHDSEAVIVTADVPCRPCLLHEPLFAYRCAYGYACLSNVGPESVMLEVGRLMDSQSRVPRKRRSLLPGAAAAIP